MKKEITMLEKIFKEIKKLLTEKVDNFIVVGILFLIDLIYSFSSGLYYKIPIEYFSFELKRSLGWILIIFIILVGAVLLFFFLISKQQEENRDRLVISLEILSCFGIVYYETLLLIHLFLNFKGFSNHISLLVLLILISVIVVSNYYAVIKKNKKMIVFSKGIAITIVLLLVFNQNRKNYEIIWIKETPKVILSKSGEKALVAKCAIDDNLLKLYINTKRYQEITLKEEYERSYFSFSEVEIEKNW